MEPVWAGFVGPRLVAFEAGSRRETEATSAAIKALRARVLNPATRSASSPKRNEDSPASSVVAVKYVVVVDTASATLVRGRETKTAERGRDENALHQVSPHSLSKSFSHEFSSARDWFVARFQKTALCGERISVGNGGFERSLIFLKKILSVCLREKRRQTCDEQTCLPR